MIWFLLGVATGIIVSALASVLFVLEVTRE